MQHATDCTGGVMAIENSIAGSILDNYRLLQKASLIIRGEVYVRVRQHLMILPGTSLSLIKEVHSHPMALRQCEPFLNHYPQWTCIESTDTALSAKQISDNGWNHVAAIGSSVAADHYKLNIIKSDIHSHKLNYTRFLWLEKCSEGPPEIHPKADKASIFFHLPHEPGSLARVLSAIAAEDINISKLQSSPMPEKEWNYYFHADLEFKHPGQLEKILEMLPAITLGLQVLGIYQKGKTV
jgi:prephenate dehydratase